jgi:hypothetical protein
VEKFAMRDVDELNGRFAQRRPMEWAYAYFRNLMVIKQHLQKKSESNNL